MPDWCFNNLRLRGDVNQLEELREAVAGTQSALDFGRVEPTPPEPLARDRSPATVPLAAMCEVAEAEDPFAWRAMRWGCIRPGAPESVLLEDTVPGALAYRLSTPWSAPSGIAATLAGGGKR